MAYKLHKNYNDFFRKLNPNRNGFNTLFDIYYLCLMIGLKYKKIGSTDMLKSDAFSKEIIDAYKDSKYKIIALLIQTEMERNKRIDQDNQHEVEKLISEIIDYESKDHISDKGVELLNLYAASGFEKIQSNINDNNHIENFFQEYLELIK